MGCGRVGYSPRAFQLVCGCARDDNPGSQLPSGGLSSLHLLPQRAFEAAVAPF